MRFVTFILGESRVLSLLVCQVKQLGIEPDGMARFSKSCKTNFQVYMSFYNVWSTYGIRCPEVGTIMLRKNQCFNIILNHCMGSALDNLGVKLK